MLDDLKGKIVVLEFWATWCGSCLEAMPHLKALQKKYDGKLQVITVTDETEKRIKLYLNSRPSNLWFAVDTGRTLAKIFPHQLLPHTVLIDAGGRLVANTSPGEITAAVIDSLLNKQTVVLKEKKDYITASPEELSKSVFPAADTVKQRFLMQPSIKGAPGMSIGYNADPVWKGRRITVVNCNLLTLYRIAYNDISYNRVLDQTDSGSQAQAYCLDLIAADPKELLPALRRELSARFDVQAALATQVRKVKLLKIADMEKFGKIKRNHTGQRTYYSMHGEIDQQAITMSDFAAYLEGYGLDNALVVDETGSRDKFDIRFSFEPENPKSLPDVLKTMGLILIDAKRPVQVLKITKLTL